MNQWWGQHKGLVQNFAIIQLHSLMTFVVSLKLCCVSKRIEKFLFMTAVKSFGGDKCETAALVANCTMRASAKVGYNLQLSKTVAVYFIFASINIDYNLFLG